MENDKSMMYIVAIVAVVAVVALVMMTMNGSSPSTKSSVSVPTVTASTAKTGSSVPAPEIETGTATDATGAAFRYAYGRFYGDTCGASQSAASGSSGWSWCTSNCRYSGGWYITTCG
jgi:hypothetical protein